MSIDRILITIIKIPRVELQYLHLLTLTIHYLRSQKTSPFLSNAIEEAFNSSFIFHSQLGL
ncbi:MAG: hypothetical protein WBA41_12065 [Rivularia sp. (in: cyanobacteria)]